MDKIDKTTAKRLGQEVEEALARVADAYGLKVKVRGGRYDATSFTPRVEFALPDADKTEFAQYAALIGLEPDDFGREFASDHGERYEITGINLRARRYPVKGTRVRDGKAFKFPATTVKRALGRTVETALAP